MSIEHKPKERTAPKTDRMHRIMIATKEPSLAEVHDPIGSAEDAGYVKNEAMSKSRFAIYEKPNEAHLKDLKRDADKAANMLNLTAKKKEAVEGTAKVVSTLDIVGEDSED